MDSQSAEGLRRLKHKPALLPIHANVLKLLQAIAQFPMSQPPISLSLSLMLWVPLATHAAGVPTLDEVVVKAKSNNLIGSANSANEGTVLKKQLDQRVVYRPGELLETVPGLIVTQHSGEGKANQYFARGFNLDHGVRIDRFTGRCGPSLPWRSGWASQWRWYCDRRPMRSRRRPLRSSCHERGFSRGAMEPNEACL